jgi:hypothetical protein
VPWSCRANIVRRRRSRVYAAKPNRSKHGDDERLVFPESQP